MGEDVGMSSPYTPTSGPAHAAAPRPRLYRSTTDQQIAGVCAGLAEHLGWQVGAVRVAFVVLAVMGPGLVGYLFLWAFTDQDVAAPQEARSTPATKGRPSLTTSQTALLGGAALVAVGVTATTAVGAVDLTPSVTVPLIAIVVGAALAWSQLDSSERRRSTEGKTTPGPMRGRVVGVVLPVVGLVVAAVGIVALASAGAGVSAMVSSGIAALAVLVGAAVIASPWVARLWRRLQREQGERARATERADIAAHLHDSVLQTLALIQRSSSDSAEVARLARAQERELRTWLYGGGPGAPEASLAGAVTAVVHAIEDQHGIPVDVVVTGDAAMTEQTGSLVRAVREAVLNAVRHGAPPVSVFVECGPTEVEAFVRDHGAGFDASAVPVDRLGVRESIVGRMERAGGAASIRAREPGTEVELRLPLRQVASAAPETS